ncbi:MAG: AraC family transcriptional regulator, partial [Oceanospirillum sp.]|nr:AraC family transcriptional regulator [Oceanospirillum sp.]
MDRLSALLNLFQPEGRHVIQENLSLQPLSVPKDECSRLYLVKSGRLQLTTPSEPEPLECQCGDLIWLPRGDAHQLSELREDARESGIRPDQQPTAVVTQIEIQFLHREPNQEQNLLQSTLPDLLYLPASESQISNLKPLVELMFQEAGQQRCGHTTVVNRLAEVLLVNLLRHLMANQKVATGVLGGLSDLRLARAMTGIHDTPGENWTLEELANTAGMSRTAFSKRFREVVGFTPADYLAQWRMS